MQREMVEKWGKGARREGADSATHRARIATLAVVQTVYPTIKSDARLCRGKSPRFRGVQTGGSSNAWAGASTRVRNKQKSSTTRAHRRSFPLSRSLYLSYPTYESHSYLISPYTKLSLSLSLSPHGSLRSYFPFLPPHAPPPRQTARLTSGRRKKCVCVWTLAR